MRIIILRSMWKSSLIMTLYVLVELILPAQVFALRPFVTTDADVVETNVVEIEYGIFGLHEQKHPGHDELTLEPSSIRFNYGLPWDSEIVLETVGQLIDTEYVGTLGIKEKQFANTLGSYKKVWWRAEIGGWIPNFATETGAIFPTEKGTSGLGFEGTGIFSWYLKNLTCHMTLGGGTTTEEFEHNSRGLFVYGLILDVPVPQYKKLRLVAEYSGEKVESALLDHQLLGGIIWDGPKDMAYDIAGFTGLNHETVDWGMTMGVTFTIGKN